MTKKKTQSLLIILTASLLLTLCMCHNETTVAVNSAELKCDDIQDEHLNGEVFLEESSDSEHEFNATENTESLLNDTSHFPASFVEVHVPYASTENTVRAISNEALMEQTETDCIQHLCDTDPPPEPTESQLVNSIVTDAAPILAAIGDPLGYLPHLQTQLILSVSLLTATNLLILTFLNERISSTRNVIPAELRERADHATDTITRISRTYGQHYDIENRRTFLYLSTLRNVVEILDPYLSQIQAVFLINNFPYLYLQEEVRSLFIEMWNEALRVEFTSPGSSTFYITDTQLMYLALTRFYIISTIERFGQEIPDEIEVVMRLTIDNIDELINQINRDGDTPRLLPFNLKCTYMERRDHED